MLRLKLKPKIKSEPPAAVTWCLVRCLSQIPKLLSVAGAGGARRGGAEVAHPLITLFLRQAGQMG